MGIKGLWKALKPYVRDGHLSQFRGQRVAIDMYVWLHQCLHDSVSVDRKRLIEYFEEKEKRKLREYEERQQAKLKEEIVISDNDNDEDNKSSTKVDDHVSPRTLATSELSEQSSSVSSRDNDLLNINDILIILPSFISSVMSKLDSVLKFGIIPVCVFDGASMPMKVSTDTARATFRRKCFKEAIDLLEQLYDRNRRYAVHCNKDHQNENTLLSRHAPAFQEALQLLERATDVSPELAYSLIHVITSERQVECLVAPYEADAQLSYLCREGFVQACISEDSDLIAYQCPTIIAKLDYYSGRCEVLRAVECAPLFYNEIAACAIASSSSNSTNNSSKRPRSGDKYCKGENMSPCTLSTPSTLSASIETQSCKPHGDTDLTSSSSSSSSSVTSPAASFTYESFLLACIMSGCDYLSNLRSIGVKTAFKLVATANSLPHLMSMLEDNFHFASEELRSYQKELLSAFYCFAHHLVYCPRQCRLVHYHPLPRVHCCPSSSSSSSPPSHQSVCQCSEEIKKTSVITSKPRAELIGRVWSPELASKICVKCSVDPGTLNLYTGVYRSCVEMYMKAIKRGQTSLKSYAGFEKHDTSKIVIKMSSLNSIGNVNKLGSCADNINSSVNNQLCASPLKKVREGVGYIGASAKGNGEANGSAYERWGRGAMIVRSKYFVHHDRAFSSEPDTQSEESDPAENTHEHAEGATPTKKRYRQVSNFNNSTNGPESNQRCKKIPKLESCESLSETQDSTSSEFNNEFTLQTESANYTNHKISALEEQALLSSSSSPLSSSSSFDTQTNTNDSNYNSGVTSLAMDAALTSKANATEESATSSCNSSIPELLGSEVKTCTQTCEADEEDIAVIGSNNNEHTKCSESVHTSTNENTNKHKSQNECCQCPYGYWQCNRPHSIFDKCFANKKWKKGEKPIVHVITSNKSENKTNTETTEMQNVNMLSVEENEEQRSGLAKHKKGKAVSRAKLAMMHPYVPRSLSAKYDSQGSNNSSTASGTSSVSKSHAPSLFKPFRAPRSSQPVNYTEISNDDNNITTENEDTKESKVKSESTVKQPSSSLFAQLSFRKHGK